MLLYTGAISKTVVIGNIRKGYSGHYSAIKYLKIYFDSPFKHDMIF